MPLYNFDPGEEGEDDWETELLDEGFGGRQRRVWIYYFIYLFIMSVTIFFLINMNSNFTAGISVN